MGAFVIPQITYPALAPTTTLAFTYPPVEKPAIDDREIVGAVSITLSGKKQTISYRQDNFKRLSMKFVPQADLANWDAFFSFALDGGSFLYYPDATASAYDEYTLEDGGGSAINSMGVISWNPKYSFRNVDEFELILRKVPGGLSSP